jgi:putative redox protein
MKHRTVSTSWLRGPLRCDVLVEDGFIVEVDEPISAGGTGKGPQPTDLFLASIASCFALAVAYSAGKLGLTLESVKVKVVGQYEGMRFGTIEIHTKVEMDQPEALERLISSAQRVCYVTNTLRTAPKVIAHTDLVPS